MSAEPVMDTGSTGRRRNRSWPEALKREIVAASFEPGCSVSVVARRYDVNSNQMFGWRKMFREGSPAQADHFSQKIGIRRLFQKGAKVHHVVGHRGILRSVLRFGGIPPAWAAFCNPVISSILP